MIKLKTSPIPIIMQEIGSMMNALLCFDMKYSGVNTGEKQSL
jgi:biotin transporter BioY